MRVATIEVTGLTPYSQSKPAKSERKPEEEWMAFEERVWRERIHVDKEGHVFIPAVGIVNGMATAASYLGKGGELKKIGSSTWAENFRCGLAVAEGPIIDKTVKDAEGEWIYANSDGKRGSGKRVWRCYPIFHSWESTFTIHILDDSIPEDVFRKVVEAFGLFNGVGRYRPQNGGYLGRFQVVKCEIKKA